MHTFLAAHLSLRRIFVQNFWSGSAVLSGGTLARLVGVLNLYNCDTEHEYLSYATNLILEMTSRGVDFNKTIFDTPLSDCRYEVGLRSRSLDMLYSYLTIAVFSRTTVSTPPGLTGTLQWRPSSLRVSAVVSQLAVSAW